MIRLHPLLAKAASVLLTLGFAALLWPQSLGGNVAFVMVSGTSMEPRMHTGDLVALRQERSYEVGDVVAYRIPEGDTGAGNLVIHRIVGGSSQAGWVTRGDNRDADDLWRPTNGDIVGTRWVLVPGTGRYVAAARNPLPMAVLAATLALLVLLPWALRDEQPVTAATHSP